MTPSHPPPPVPALQLSTTSPRLRFVAFLVLSLCLAGPAHAQADRTGRLEGRVIDSIRARPLVGARVIAVRMDTLATTRGDASTDSAGKYHIDSLPPGRYAVGFESLLLDSLEINVSPRWIVIAPGQTATIDLALPPAAKLRAAHCPGLTLPLQTGVLFGHVVDSESENPLRDVVVAMSWHELDVDRATLRPVNQERIASVTTDDRGWYRVCGVPTGTWISLQLQHEGRTGPVLRMQVDDTLGLAVQHLSFATSAARAIAETDTTSVGGNGTDGAPLYGTATLSGVVLGPDGVPIALADVRVRGTAASTRTDARGGFSLAALPAGTQMLLVRHLGFAIVETSVELRAGMKSTSTVRLQRVVVNLDSMRVVATRVRYPDFAMHQKSNIFGRYLGTEEIDMQHANTTSDIIAKIPFFHIVGTGPKAKVVSARGPACTANIVVDGARYFEINDVPAVEIGAIEAYPALAPSYPIEYGANPCGLVIIWTKR
ncbi:MAG: TonB-dependent receptor plug [Gemmatimonadetes bacterium]|nr:TonB-dependent receptor plug [Gemmatimonadota bacterium]